jgi:glc operon protein GlcG
MHATPTLGHEDAMRAIEAIRSELSRGGQAAVIAVADPNGELIGLLRLDGSLISSVQIAIAKAFTAARLRRPSRALSQSGFDVAYYGDSRYVGFAGGLPILHGGAVVGGIGVSGLSPEREDEVAALGIQAILDAVSTGT